MARDEVVCVSRHTQAVGGRVPVRAAVGIHVEWHVVEMCVTRGADVYLSRVVPMRVCRAR